MGHLINPTGFRLGFFRSWKDNWVAVNTIAYSELLHNSLTIKDYTRHYIYRLVQKKQKASLLIFSHFNLEQRMTNKFALQIYFYDTQVENSYRFLRAACRRIHYRQRFLAKRFFKLHRTLVFKYSKHLLNTKEASRLFFHSMFGRGFLDYLLVRRLVFLFLCAVMRDKSMRLDRGLLIQIKVGLYALLEYNWRKNLFLKKPLNFFEFFIGVFLQMKFLEKGVEPNAIRANFMYMKKKARYRKKKDFYGNKTKELLFLIKWFRFGRMSLINKLWKRRPHTAQSLDLSKVKSRHQLMSPHYLNRGYQEYQTQLFLAKERQQKYLLDRARKRALFLRKREKARARFKSRTRKTTFKKSSLVSQVRKATGVSKYFKHISNVRHGVSPIAFNRIRSTLTEQASRLYALKMAKLFYWLSERQINLFLRFRYAASSDLIKSLKHFTKRTRSNIVSLQYSSSLDETARSNHGLNMRYLNHKRAVNKIKKETLSDVVSPMGSWNLLAYTYVKYSYTLWQTKTKLLRSLGQSGVISGRKLFRSMSSRFSTNAVWANQLFLDFYRIFFARLRYLYSFGFVKLRLETQLNEFSLYPVTVDFFGLDNDLITASFVSFYLSRKFLQNFKIRELFGAVGADLRRVSKYTPFLIGYKLQFVGRLRRRDRLRTSWVMGGVVPLSTMTASIDYSQEVSILRNGMCSIKVWLYRPPFYGDSTRNFLFKVIY